MTHHNTYFFFWERENTEDVLNDWFISLALLCSFLVFRNYDMLALVEKHGFVGLIPFFLLVTLVFLSIHPHVLSFLSLWKNNCTLYCKPNISHIRICQYLERHVQTLLLFLFLWLLCLYALYMVIDLQSDTSWLAIKIIFCHFYPVKYVTIKALYCFLQLSWCLRPFTFCIWEQLLPL